MTRALGAQPWGRALLTTMLALVAAPAGARAQLQIGGYALGVGTHARASDLGPAGRTLLGRVRVMPEWSRGPVSVDVAYEHVLTRTPSGGGIGVTTPGGTAAGTEDWLGTDWAVRSTSRSDWRHRLDRLAASFDAGDVSLTVGRQAISWATTLFLTPSDPFAPFDPSDPFREYRGGVDAVRARYFLGPFSELEAVVRPTKTATGTTLTALGRAQTSWGGWSVGAWGGVLHDEGALALFATGTAGSTALRGSVSVRRDPSGGATARAAAGADRRFTLVGRDLYAVVEIQYDGFGASRASDLLDVASSAPYLRGEMQTVGRWTAAGQASWQMHPLVAADFLALVNLADGSALLAPGLSWSATGSTSVRAGFFIGAGAASVDPLTGFASEYGPVPLLGYLALSLFM